ncbi:hypothetical protein K505DRAFT_364254 [Melanomma pulvis-pyrius CBS 109.77]|uniref:Uncharacterized protein n=1 Tax=Melanomma pulvis-pyrius CBS 109.77 TaxID=1314802 RepID=A0A6A6X3Q9_9PLEO|nr:hypothetical protein K505DRAFT_364254 [Melanomma pulvis-pyrius CBS 109.77]
MAQSRSSRWWWRLTKARTTSIVAKTRGNSNTSVTHSKSEVFWPSMLMLMPLILGVAFALGHHLFFTHLSGRVVPDTHFINSARMQLSTQQANLAIGNAFAFLVKVCLNTAVGIAYVQLFWATIFQKPQTISAVDTMFSSLSNFFTLGRGRVWWQHPLLLLLALTVWLSPLQSIFTPATLTIRTDKISPTPSQMVHVPRVDFTRTNFAKVRTNAGGLWAYTGFSDTVKAAVTATCMLGTIKFFRCTGSKFKLANRISWSVPELFSRRRASEIGYSR